MEDYILSCCVCLSSSDLVHWGAWHFWFWGLREQQLRTVLHQLRQRAAPALLQPAHLQIRAGRVLFPLPLYVPFWPLFFFTIQTMIIVLLLTTRHCILCFLAPVTMLTPKHSHTICYGLSWYPVTSVYALASHCCGCYTFLKNAFMLLIQLMEWRIGAPDWLCSFIRQAGENRWLPLQWRAQVQLHHVKYTNMT